MDMDIQTNITDKYTKQIKKDIKRDMKESDIDKPSKNHFSKKHIQK